MLYETLEAQTTCLSLEFKSAPCEEVGRAEIHKCQVESHSNVIVKAPEGVQGGRLKKVAQSRVQNRYETSGVISMYFLQNVEVKVVLCVIHRIFLRQLENFT
jgi:hypothetical protein